MEAGLHPSARPTGKSHTVSTWVGHSMRVVSKGRLEGRVEDGDADASSQCTPHVGALGGRLDTGGVRPATAFLTLS